MAIDLECESRAFDPRANRRRRARAGGTSLARSGGGGHVMATFSSPGPFSRFTFGRPIAYDAREVRVASRPLTSLASRIMLGAIFMVSGIAKLVDPEGAIGYMNAQGVPAAGTLVYIAGLAEIAGAASLMTGFLTRIGALGLIVFLAITTGYFHDFWNLADPERKTQMVQFMKNLAIAGGLMLVVAEGAGRYSLDALLSRGAGKVDGVLRSS
jgi:putative oxidoreductase